jgi:putative RNA 2'-phosphotransferase
VAKPSRETVTLSKRLSYVLRHAPGSIGVELDAGGWVAVDELLAAFARHGQALSRAELEQLVQRSDKRRFAFSADGGRIRASQGHSVAVELGYAAQTPPELLFHGTIERYLAAIRDQGLHKGRRHHVHLSVNRELALIVARRRRGSPVVLEVAAGAMAREGFELFCSDNGVWLVSHVPARFLTAG